MSNDKLVFDLSAVTKAAKEYSQPTKRQITSIVSKIYYPLGLLSPLVTPLKMFVRDLSISKMKWDDLLPSSLLRRWNVLVEGLTK